MIDRYIGNSPAGRSVCSGYRDLVWAVATATDESLDLASQTKQALENLDKNLAELGADKTSILSAQVFLADIDDKPVMDEVWNSWIGDNSQHWPQRACVGVSLGGHWLVEITVTAVRSNR